MKRLNIGTSTITVTTASEHDCTQQHNTQPEHPIARLVRPALEAYRGTLRPKRHWHKQNLHEGQFTMDEIKEKNVKSGQQGTKEPWKKPEKSDHHPTKDSPSPRPRRPEDNETS